MTPEVWAVVVALIAGAALVFWADRSDSDDPGEADEEMLQYIEDQDDEQ